MKGNEKVITVLNSLLADELTAINQYMVQSEMCANWGYCKLYSALRKQAMEEMHHAEWLIERILFFEGLPTVSILNPLNVGTTVSEMVSSDDNTKLNAVREYNEAIKIAHEESDEGTVELLTIILKMEEDHVNWAEIQSSQIEQMGLGQYLATQN